jgi:hypothetical protein
VKIKKGDYINMAAAKPEKSLKEVASSKVGTNPKIGTTKQTSYASVGKKK